MPKRKRVAGAAATSGRKKGQPGRRRKADSASDSEEDTSHSVATRYTGAVFEAEESREKIILEGAKVTGQLILCGATNWDLVGRRDVPKHQGRGDKGQLGHGDAKRVDIPRAIETLKGTNIVLAACGRSQTLCLTDSGTVYSFGENNLGQLGLGNQTDSVSTPTPIAYHGQPIVKVACGAEFSVIVDCKGSLYTFGCPQYGQLGHNSDGRFIARANKLEFVCELVPRRIALFVEKTRDGIVLPVPAISIVGAACGANHTLALDVKGRVFSWGFGGYGRLGHAEPRDEMVPRLIKVFDIAGRGAKTVFAGYTCSFALNERGALYSWGTTNTSRESTMYPKVVQDLTGWKIRSLCCGKSSIMVAADESTISWGPSPAYGELGYGENKNKSSTIAQEVKALDGIYIEQVAMGYSHTLFIARNDSEEEKARIERLPEYIPRII